MQHSEEGRSVIKFPEESDCIFATPCGKVLCLDYKNWILTLLHLPTKKKLLEARVLTREDPRRNAITVTKSHVFVGGGWEGISVCVYPFTEEGGEAYTFSLPSIPEVAAVAQGELFLAVFPEAVIVHDAGTRKTREIMHPDGEWPALWCQVMLDVEGDRFTLVYVDKDQHGVMWIDTHSLSSGERLENVLLRYDWDRDIMRRAGKPWWGWSIAEGVYRLGTSMDADYLVMLFWDMKRRKVLKQKVQVGWKRMVMDAAFFEGGCLIWVRHVGTRIEIKNVCYAVEMEVGDGETSLSGDGWKSEGTGDMFAVGEAGRRRVYWTGNQWATEWRGLGDEDGEEAAEAEGGGCRIPKD